MLFLIGILVGFIIDKLVDSKKFMFKLSQNELPLHTEDDCNCFNLKEIVSYLKNPTIYRLILIAIVVTLLIMVSIGILAGDEESWIRASIIFVISISIFIVLTVPEHFLKDHLWGHVTKVHTPRIFLWVFSTLLVFNILLKYLNINALISENIFYVLIIAVLIGIIPESGPHFIFIALFTQGVIPFSVLLASSISQDGHGMLPLLAESRKSFVVIKIVNVIIALLIGGLALLIGF